MRTVHLTGANLLLLGLLFCRLDGAAAEVSDAARQACTSDAMRLCSDVIPDVARVTACMKGKSSQLSPACRVFCAAARRTVTGIITLIIAIAIIAADLAGEVRWRAV